MRPPFLFRRLFRSLVWNIQTKDLVLFLTFDDGPIPEVTPTVLSLLKKYNAKATFFCIGDNVNRHPDIFNRLINEGHIIGNHTFNHLNGWKTKTDSYIQNIEKCHALIKNNLFRPPYGKITPTQYSILKKGYSIIMWDVLSGDWKSEMSAEDCFENVKRKSKPGSIIVFHDSLKAEKRMLAALEKTLEYFSKKGFRFQSLSV
jgi:peptidoglycan/xylan/chitin deacetylase (PgdA/CDA1 family)